MILWLPVDTRDEGIVYINPNQIELVTEDHGFGVIRLNSGRELTTVIEGRPARTCQTCQGGGAAPTVRIRGVQVACSTCNGTQIEPAVDAAKMTSHCINEALSKTVAQLQQHAQTRASLTSGLDGLAPRNVRG